MAYQMLHKLKSDAKSKKIITQYKVCEHGYGNICSLWRNTATYFSKVAGSNNVNFSSNCSIGAIHDIHSIPFQTHYFSNYKLGKPKKPIKTSQSKKNIQALCKNKSAKEESC